MIARRTILTIAARSGWLLQKMSSIGAVKGSIVRLALARSQSWATAQSTAQTNASGKTRPTFGSLKSSTATLTIARRTPGATPTMPTLFFAAPTMPEVSVPWPIGSVAHAVWAGLATPPTQLALALASTRPARSGWVMSTPESNSPAITDGLPLVIARACGA